MHIIFWLIFATGCLAWLAIIAYLAADLPNVIGTLIEAIDLTCRVYKKEVQYSEQLKRWPWRIKNILLSVWENFWSINDSDSITIYTDKWRVTARKFSWKTFKLSL